MIGTLISNSHTLENSKLSAPNESYIEWVAVPGSKHCQN